jgi:hypothetical protein
MRFWDFAAVNIMRSVISRQWKLRDLRFRGSENYEILGFRGGEHYEILWFRGGENYEIPGFRGSEHYEIWDFCVSEDCEIRGTHNGEDIWGFQDE